MYERKDVNGPRRVEGKGVLQRRPWNRSISPWDQSSSAIMNTVSKDLIGDDIAIYQPRPFPSGKSTKSRSR